MYKSILQFCEEGIINLENVSADFYENPEDIAGFVAGVSSVFIKAGCGFIGDIFSELNQKIRESQARKDKWEIVRTDTKKMLCSLGEFSYEKTLFKHKETGERTYLLDHYLGIESFARLTEDAQARMLEEAVQTSYSRAGNHISITDSISKGTVKNKLHELKFPKAEYPEELKKVEYLYIDADEDHVPLQFIDNKGDLKTDKSGRTINNVQAKLVYVYEGIEPESPAGKRFKLVNPHYFSGVYEGKDNEKLWEEVYEYIENTYDLDSVKKIYLNADGGSWIKTGKSKIAGIVSVLDEYHINKYLTSMTTHLYDSAEDGRNLLRDVIRRGTKAEFMETVKTLKDYTEDSNTVYRIETGAAYITSNWTAAKTRLSRSAGVVGSSTEGHVSHVLASRMSSRPMGWSKQGADKMARLRAYYWNGGNMLNLVRYQVVAECEKKAAGAEYLSANQIMKTEGIHHIYGTYYDHIQVSLSVMARKTLAIRERLLLL